MGELSERTKPGLDTIKALLQSGAVKTGTGVLTALMTAGLLAGCSTGPNNAPSRPETTQTESAADRATREAREKVLEQIKNPEQAVQIIAEPLVVTKTAELRSAANKLIPQNLNPAYASDLVAYEKEMVAVVNDVNAIKDPRINTEARAYLNAEFADGVAGSYVDYPTYEGGDNASKNTQLIALRRKQANLITAPVTKETSLEMLDLNIAQGVAGANKPTKDSEALKDSITSEEYRDLATKALAGDKEAKDKLDKLYSDLNDKLNMLSEPAKKKLVYGDAEMAKWVNQDLVSYAEGRKATPGDSIPAYKDIAWDAASNIKDSATLKIAKDILPLIPSAEVQDQMKQAVDGKILDNITRLQLSPSSSLKSITDQVGDALATVNGMYSPEVKTVAGSQLSELVAALYTANYIGVDNVEYYQGLLKLLDIMPDQSYKALAVKIKGGADAAELRTKAYGLVQAAQKLPEYFAYGTYGKLYAGSNDQAKSVNRRAVDYIETQ